MTKERGIGDNQIDPKVLKKAFSDLTNSDVELQNARVARKAIFDNAKDSLGLKSADLRQLYAEYKETEAERKAELMRQARLNEFRESVQLPLVVLPEE